ncbi:MAG: hypothetical protein KAR38_07325, partial [Calditrichia bacterium]|nr:hypothetical protein [Calditrichia bacterium]
SAIPVLIAALISSPKFLKALPAVLLIAVFILSSFASQVLKSNRKDRIPTIYEHWDATSKVRIGTYGDDDMYRNIEIDHAANTPVARFDGNWDRPDSMKFEFDMDVKFLSDKFESCTFLALGAGGGQEVMQAIQNGAKEIHAVEVIPHINELMTTGELADFTGRIYHDPRVTVATEDARAYVRRFKNKFDIIFSSSSNSWAALASGSFALAENYLFTTEAFEDYWNSLSDNGFLIMEHQIYMPRLVSEVMDALENMDILNPKDHFAVYNMPNRRRNILLFSKQPLTDEIRVNAFAPAPKEAHNYKHLLYPAVDSLKGNLINQIVENGWEKASDKAVIDISPATDNQPFVAQLGMWKNFSFEKLDKVSPIEFNGFPLTKMNIVIILLIVIAFIIPLNLIPYLKKGDKLKAAPWFYFFLIGMAFMMVEIVLMQKYTLFIGPSIYSMITILLTLLFFSGIGSRFSDKIDSKIAFGGIIVWLLLDILVFKLFFSMFGGLTMFPRILISALLIAPLGFFMGIPFPKASLKVGPLVDWGFAVNGAASVLGSTLVVLIVFNFGFSFALVTGALLYLAAFGLISMEKVW